MPGTNLTHDEARERAELVTIVDHYDVHLDLTRGDRTFATRTTVTFTSTSPGSSTFIDFIGPSVERIDLNGTSLDPARHFDGSRIALPAVAADNTLVVEATAEYTNSGQGLHRFVDPVDGEAYLYSQFEVADCHRMFTVFDQPDLKATYALTVTAPDHWQVVSNTPTPEPTPAGDGSATWAFPATRRISSYITALVAGPYDIVRDAVETRAGTIPLGIFCRRSLREYLDPEELFDITKRGFAFFEREFDQPYPFTKYDTLFCPEYNMGAMENAGCVTVAEVYVFRGRVTDRIVERRALTLLHELAHMWFGDLVTMRWWNDLWLNESFAEWASTACQAEATRWTDAWATFGTFEKEWAYRQDQQSTTHPVVAPIRDLHDVEVNFDGITYAKGAACLKQLVAFVGREPFMAGLRTYFAKHAWGNTTLADLLGELSATSGRDLTAWSTLWLETPGVNTLTPVVEVGDDGRLRRVTIEQASPDGVPLRPHRVAVGLYTLDGDTFHRTRRVELDVAGASSEVTGLAGDARPDVLVVNDDDLTYAKVRFDANSLQNILAHPTGFADALPRMTVATALWDMVRHAELPAETFVDYVLALVDGLHDSTLLTVLLTRLMDSVLAAVPLSVLTYADPAHRDELRRRTLARLEELTRSADGASDAQLQLATAWLEMLAPGDDTAYARSLLDGTETLPGLQLDNDMRWRLLTALAACGSADEAEVEAENARDNTATGRELAAQALAARPTPEAKAEAWRRAIEEDGLSNAVVAHIGLGFSRHGVEHILQEYVDPYHAVIEQVWTERPLAMAEAVVKLFYPQTLADERLLTATQGWLDTHPEAPAALVRLVSEKRDGVARALAAQAKDARR